MGLTQAALKMWPSEGHLDLGITFLVLSLDPLTTVLIVTWRLPFCPKHMQSP